MQICFSANFVAKNVFVNRPNSLQQFKVVASLDKMLYDDYLCLVESGKQQIKEVRRKFNRKT